MRRVHEHLPRLSTKRRVTVINRRYRGPIGSILTPIQTPEKHNTLPFACTLCGSCTDVCPVKIDLHQQLFIMREVLDGKKLIGTSKKLSMKLAAAVMSRTWLFNMLGSMARVSLRWLPRFLVYNRLNPWGKQRELLRLQRNHSARFMLSENRKRRNKSCHAHKSSRDAILKRIRQVLPSPHRCQLWIGERLAAVR